MNIPKEVFSFESISSSKYNWRKNEWAKKETENKTIDLTEKNMTIDLTEEQSVKTSKKPKIEQMKDVVQNALQGNQREVIETEQQIRE